MTGTKPRAKTPRAGWGRGECKRSGHRCLAVVLFLLLAITPAGAETRKVRVNDPATAQDLLAHGGKLIADYGGFQVIETGQASGRLRPAGADPDVIELNARRISTRSTAWRAAPRSIGRFSGRKFHLVQFAGPIKPEWRQTLIQFGARIINYIPQNAYLIYADSEALSQIRSWTAAASVVQWAGNYADDDKLQPGARLTDANGFPQTLDTDTFAVQLVEDAEANTNTLQWIARWQLAPVQRQFRTLQFLNLVVRLPADHLVELAAQPDVVSIQPYVEPAMRDERQAQILAGNLTGASPSWPGYLAWLAGKGFTQEQFDASGFVVDVTDSGIDNGTTQPGHFGLYRSGDPNQASRVSYNRLEGTAHAGSTTVGGDGHGTLNAHILAGFNNFSGGFPHADPQGFRYGLGICPFVRVGASVVFDPSLFTNPNYADLQSRAFQSGARISANSWGMTNNTYTMDAQSYDALVRDAQPDGAAVAAPGNQEMVIVFAAGNRGSGYNTVGAPGTAKNVITVGASEGVRSLNLAGGGNSSMGSDGCGYNDVSADGAFDLASFSSRGPCSDGRLKPDLVAPGTHITGGVVQAAATTNGTGAALAEFTASSLCALNGGGTTGNANNFFPLGQQFYTVSSGTSHAVPAVAGACALLRQYFLNAGWPAPSPAMTKAFLMNSTRYLTGAGANDNLWSPGQGMGEVNLGRAFDGVARLLRDQQPEDLFTASGQRRVFTGRVADPSQPVRVTLAWTDAPGSTTGNAFNNDLDLTLTIGTNTYLGNNFSGSLSVTGGVVDARNNVESVLLPAGQSGPIVVTVTAANINSDGVPNNDTALDQDFALVVYNVTSTAVPLISAVESSLVAESSVPANHAVDAGETVIMSVTLNNQGSAPTTNLLVTMLATNGVVAPGAAQTYGALSADGEPASRRFTFTADGVCGDTIRPILKLQDGTNDLGTVTLHLPLGLRITQSTSFTNLAAFSIPDSGMASTYPSTIHVSGLTGVVTKVVATLAGYTHTWPDDVDVLLVGPGDQKVLLMSDCGGGYARNDVTFTFDDDAVALLADNAANPSGSYKPTNFDSTTDNFPTPAPAAPFGTTLASFNGQDPNGDWSLYVQDDGSLDAGNLAQGWSLSLTTSNLVCESGTGRFADLGVVASASPGSVAVGSNLTLAITVTNRGPDGGGFVTLTNELPPGLSFVSASVSQGICGWDGSAVMASLGDLAPGGSATLILQTVATAAGTLTNRVSVGGLTPDPQPADNVATLTLVIDSGPGGTGASGTNAPLRLAAIADRTVHAGSLVTVSNAVTGATSGVTFSLAAGAPPGASIEPATGWFHWQTTDADANTTNAITVRVADQGAPPQTDARSFAVTVVPRPLIAGIAVNNGMVTVAWNSLVGQAYCLECRTNLLAGDWQSASPAMIATSPITTHTNALNPIGGQFFRVRVLP